MADDQYVAVIDSKLALHAVDALVKARRGYLLLIDKLVTPYPLEHQFDQSKRNQMITLISRADSLWVLALVNSESGFVGKSAASAREARKRSLGEHLTRATIARGLAIYDSNDRSAVPERRHSVAAARLVEAGLSFGLFETGLKPDEKQQPILGTKRLAQLMHAIGDHVYWSMSSVFREGVPAVDTRGVSESGVNFERENNQSKPNSRIAESDHFFDWFSKMSE